MSFLLKLGVRTAKRASTPIGTEGFSGVVRDCKGRLEASKGRLQGLFKGEAGWDEDGARECLCEPEGRPQIGKPGEGSR